MRRPMHRRLGGYTLMEVLVVIAIVGFISTVLMQALAQAYGLQRRIGTQVQRSQDEVMQLNWVRELLQGLLPDVAGGPRRLRGTATEITGQALDPFGRDMGVPQPITLSLSRPPGQAGSELVLKQDSRSLTLMAWPAGVQPRFSYVDAKGEAHDQWPPALGLWPPLPSVVQLHHGSAGDDRLLIAVPRSNFEPLNPASDLLLVQP